jgi:MFS family permease
VRASDLLRVVLGTGVAVIGATPVFMIGALGVLIGADFHTSAARVGVLGSVFFGTSALSTPRVARLVDARGGGPGTALALSSAGTCCLLISAAPTKAFGLLLVAAVVGGIGHATSIVLGNAFLSHPDLEQRRGGSFAIKQSAFPAASMLAGLSVPLAVALGSWRGLFAVMGAFTATTGATAYRAARRLLPPTPEVGLRTDRPMAAGPIRTLRMFAVAHALASFATLSVPVFAVDAGVARGLSVGSAGTVLAMGSVGSIAVRLLAGVGLDRYGYAAAPAIVACMGLGAAGFVGMAVTSQAALFGVLTVLATAFGWGYTALLFLRVMELAEGSARSAGVVVSVGSMVGAVGPALFGTLVEQLGYRISWSVAAGCMTAALVVAHRSDP